MTTTGNILTDILVIWVPVALTLLMGIIGLLRGAQREAIVTLSIVVGALLISVWVSSGYWASDLHDAFSGLGQQDTETWLGVILLVLITLVVGYGLGSALIPRGPLSGASRVGGLLLGLVNGAALGGWFLRNYYSALQLDLSGSNGTVFNALQSNVITYWLIIWAGWFPVVAALIGAIIALVGPFRRAQTVVATPAAQTNWQPSTAPAAATAAAVSSSYTPQYAQPYPQPQPQQQYTQPYAQQYQPQFGAQPQAAVPPPVQPTPAAYAPVSYSAAPPSPTSAPEPARMQDAPPTMPMPTGSDTSYFGSSSPSPSSPTSAPTSGALPSSSGPITGPLGEASDSAQNQSSTPAWAQTPDSSWLATPKSGDSSSSDSSAVARSEAPTMAYPVTSGSAPSTSTSGSGALSNCPRCGALVPGDAAFCTECGNRLKG
jgi:uncharacterized membrane protein required for colicin V production